MNLSNFINFNCLIMLIYAFIPLWGCCCGCLTIKQVKFNCKYDNGEFIFKFFACVNYFERQRRRRIIMQFNYFHWNMFCCVMYALKHLPFACNTAMMSLRWSCCPHSVLQMFLCFCCWLFDFIRSAFSISRWIIKRILNIIFPFMFAFKVKIWPQ